MTRSGAVLGVCALVVVTPGLPAQTPTVSPIVERLARIDTTLSVWLFARPSADLSVINSAVVAAGGRPRRTSRWLHAVSADLEGETVVAMLARTDLHHIQLVRRFRRPRTPIPTPSPPAFGLAAPTQDSVYGPSAMPLRRLNMLPVVERGVRGAGVRIAVFDTGFETDLPLFAAAIVFAQFDFVFNDSVVRNEVGDAVNASTHGTQVWSLLAANVPDTLLGIAPDASYLLAKTEDVRSETRLEEDNYVAALEWADSIGVDIVSSSIGYTLFDDLTGYGPSDMTGDIAVTTVAADLAAERGILIVTAVGNQGAEGATSLITPADADSVIAVGAEDSLGAVAVFSSRGPTADGRIKPDLSAPGVAVWVAVPNAGLVTFNRVNGTSFATPIVAGAAVLFKEIHPGLGPIAIREALRNAADNREAPDNDRGWGRPDLLRAVTFPQGVTLLPPGPPVLETITPTFTWSVPNTPAFAQPMSYRLRLGEDTAFARIITDITLPDTTFTLLSPLAPGTPLAVELTATSADSVKAVVRGDTLFETPEWVVLQALDDPGGTTTREFRPTFTWSSPDVASPPGPFLFSVSVVRAVDGDVDVLGDSITTTSFTPEHDLERNTPYRWRVTAHVGSDSVTVESRGTFVIVDDTAPPVTALFQNFPNPFPNTAIGQSATCFWFDLAVDGVVRLDVLDLRGHIARTLIPADGLGPFLLPGRYGRPSAFAGGRCDPRLEWDGTTADGTFVPPGVYLAKLATSDGTFFKRVVFLGPP